jgi:hypothetical protein
VPVRRDPKSTHLNSQVRNGEHHVRVYCLATERSFTGLNWVIHGGAARIDMQVFILECWFKYSDEGRLKYNIEIWYFDMAKDSPSSHE